MTALLVLFRYRVFLLILHLPLDVLRLFLFRPIRAQALVSLLSVPREEVCHIVPKVVEI